MFSTFDGRPIDVSYSEKDDSGTSSGRTRQKRSQVSRACDWCRVRRIRCDSNFPCSNCSSRGGVCNNDKKKEIRTLPQALREIERLRLKVRELEARLEDQAGTGKTSNFPSTPQDDRNTSSENDSANSPVTNKPDRSRQFWTGIYTSPAQSKKKQYYGPISAFYFIGRMKSYLDLTLQHMHTDGQMLPISASRSFTSPVTLRDAPLLEDGSTYDISASQVALTRSQEEYFISLFWQSYHYTYPVVDEADFRRHYQSLWIGCSSSRRPSAIVDIVLALCLQYGTAFLPRKASDSTTSEVDSNDATISGRWYYHRCQATLNTEMENPSLATVQAQLLCCVYLCNGSFQNMAHSYLAMAVRTGHVLGLYLEPSANLPFAQKELRKRIWWTVYAIEIKTSAKLNRPWTAAMATISCGLPSDSQEAAAASGSDFFLDDKSITWLSFGLQVVKFYIMLRGVCKAFYLKASNLLDEIDGESLYSRPESLENMALSLFDIIKLFQAWSRELPVALKMKRRGSGEPLSTDRTPLDVDELAPLWLQRQRLVLEMLYHNSAMNLYRPFICFNAATSMNTPRTERAATLSVSHAITMTLIMKQMITETDLLTGWHEAYQWQWNAALTLIGFVLAYPLSPSAPAVRKTVKTAIEVFESFGDSFAIAASAANVTRDLMARAELLAERFRTGTPPPTPSASESLGPAPGDFMQGASHNLMPESWLGTETPSATEENAGGYMGLSFSVDCPNSIEPFLFGDIGTASMWNSGFE